MHIGNAIERRHKADHVTGLDLEIPCFRLRSTQQMNIGALWADENDGTARSDASIDF